MLADKAKKQRDIVITMIELKTLFIIPVIFSIVNPVPELAPVRSVIESVALGHASSRACLNLLIITGSAVGII